MFPVTGPPNSETLARTPRPPPKVEVLEPHWSDRTLADCVADSVHTARRDSINSTGELCRVGRAV